MVKFEVFVFGFYFSLLLCVHMSVYVGPVGFRSRTALYICYHFLY